MLGSHRLGPGGSSGLGQICTPPPWRYLGHTVEIRFQQDVDRLADELPSELTPTGVCSFSFVRMTTLSGIAEWNDDYPERCLHSELLYKVEVSYAGRLWNFCPFSLVDSDAALMRGWLMGFPKRLGRIALVVPPGGFGEVPPGAADFFRRAAASATSASSAPINARVSNLSMMPSPRSGHPFLLTTRLLEPDVGAGHSTFVTPKVVHYAKPWEMEGEPYLGGVAARLPDDLPTIEPLGTLSGHYFQDYVEIAGVQVVE